MNEMLLNTLGNLLQAQTVEELAAVRVGYEVDVLGWRLWELDLGERLLQLLAHKLGHLLAGDDGLFGREC